MNCVHSGHCIFERTARTPVLHCAEHQVPVTAGKALPPVSRVIDSFVPTGLCITCDHVKTCSLRSPERIVLHCEHYE